MAEKVIDQIILIDDDPVANFLHRRLVLSEMENIPLKTYENARVALDYITSHPEVRYLIFLDINMPVMNGWEFLETLEQEEIGIRGEVIVLTSSIEEADKNRALRYSPVQDFVSKPLKREYLSVLASKL